MRTPRPDLPPGPWRDLVDLLRRLRSAQTLTDRRVAERAHLSPSYLSEILNGRKPPGADAAERLVRAFGGADEVAMQARVFAEKQLELTEHLREEARRRAPRSTPIRDVSINHADDGLLAVGSGNEPFQLEPFPPEVPLDPAAAEDISLSVLLRSAHRVVPFLGREAELTKLASWRDGAEPMSVLLLHGPGGQGKTRLAARFAEDSTAAGWLVVQARHHSDAPSGPSESVATDTAVSGLLIVVDYAERWPYLDLQRLLRHRLLRRFERVRVLLLARPADYWWKAFAHPLTTLGATRDELALGALADTVAQRRVAFSVARNRFAEILGVAGVTRLHPPGSLSDRAYDLTLTLHMAALAVVDARRRGVSAPDDPAGLSRYLLRREYDHWQTMVENRRVRVDARTMARLVAVATLTQSLPASDATGLLVRVGLAGSHAESLGLLDDHQSCYPSDDGELVLVPLRPDRLGEDFLADVWPAQTRGSTTADPWMGRILEQMLPRDDALPAYGPSVLTVLVETGRRWTHVRDLYVTPLLLDRPQLALQAGAAALATLADYAVPEVLTAIDAILPDDRQVELDSGIAALASRLTAHALGQVTDDATRARLKDELASRLSHAGLYREAVSAAEEAVSIRRGLSIQDPAGQEPSLANSLGNLGIDLWNLGRHEDALDAMTEAVEVYRRRASAEPHAYDEDLAAELTNLAGAMIGVDRYPDGLGPAEEAAGILRRLSQASPALRYELAAVLRNLAVILDRLGRGEEALAAIEETVEIYRALGADRGDRYEVDLTEALRSLGTRLANQARYAEALDVTEESVAISRRLAATNPDAHRLGLALALTNLASRRWRVEQHEASLAASEEAVRVWRDLAEENPRASDRGLAMALNDLAGRLTELGRPDDALPFSEEAVSTWQRLAAVAPGRFDRQLDRAVKNHQRLLGMLREPRAR